jgi:hypothetical protein
MRRLGHGLRVEARSLSEHVADKDDILDGIENLVRSDIEIPRQGPTGRGPPTSGDLGPQGPVGSPLGGDALMSGNNIEPAMTHYLWQT